MVTNIRKDVWVIFRDAIAFLKDSIENLSLFGWNKQPIPIQL